MERERERERDREREREREMRRVGAREYMVDTWVSIHVITAFFWCEREVAGAAAWRVDSPSARVCVCVCVGERESESERALARRPRRGHTVAGATQALR